MWFAVGLFFLACFGANLSNGDGHVVDLTKSGFNETISNNTFVLVKFFAPWCKHCKTLKPEYVKACEILSYEGSPVVLAEVDATEATGLAETYQIRGYPTLILFINGTAFEYTGNRDAHGIVSWLKKKTATSVRVVDSLDEYDKIVENEEFFVVGITDNTECKDWETFLNVSFNSDENFFRVTTKSLLDKFNYKNGVFVAIVRQFDEPIVEYKGEMAVEELSKFVKSERFPLVIEFSDKIASMVFKSGIEMHLIAFMDDQDRSDEHMAVLKKVGAEYRGLLHVVLINTTDEAHDRILSFFGVKKESCPTYRLIKLDEKVQKFKPEKIEFEFEKIKTFIDETTKGNIKPLFLSEEVPSNWDAEPVKVLVGKNFRSVAYDSTKGVLVVFYAPWCGQCKSLMPTLVRLADQFKDHSDIVIAKLDATVNEIEDIVISSYPTIKFFSKGHNQVIDCGNDRSFELLKDFITKNMGIEQKAADIRVEL